jgi:hypothetical protein
MANTAIKRKPTKKPSNNRKGRRTASKASSKAPKSVSGETSAEDAPGDLATRMTDLENRVKAGDFKTLIEQIDAEYQLSWWYMKPKFDEWGLRLKLYNNQRRDKEAVGDTLLFTIHQTVLASLYGDQLLASFLGREAGDEDVAENLGDMAEFDYDEMKKDELDYNWDWDTLFFGRGLVLMYEFDRERKCPVPENIDPMTFMRDPRAKSANGDAKGRGALRFWGREVRLTINEMREAGVYFNFADLKPDGNDFKSFLDEASRIRDDAQGHTNIQRLMMARGENADHKLLEWNTYWKGKKVMVVLGNNRKQIVRYHEYPKTLGSVWPLIDRPLFPMSNDWDGVSIPDLVEDKQRARAVLQNLGLKAAKSNVHPMYLYDTTRIKNRNDLNFGFNKFIGVDGNPTGSIQTMPKDTVKQEVSWIMDLLDANAQKATATPDMQQGQISGKQRTLGELQLVNSHVDTRYSLAARIFGWSEKRFWRMWYMRYKEHFESGIDEKVIRISGALGYSWRPLTRENIVGEVDPDIKIESKAVSDAKRANDLNSFIPILPLFQMDKNANLRYAEKRAARLSGMKKDEVDQLLPPTIEEMKADDENEMLNLDKLVMVSPTDDHRLHMEVHNKATDTPAKYAHIQAHKKALILQRTNPELVPQIPSALNPTDGNPPQPFQPTQTGAPSMGKGTGQTSQPTQ